MCKLIHEPSVPNERCRELSNNFAITFDKFYEAVLDAIMAPDIETGRQLVSRFISASQ